jgi:hypothetical protein
VCRARVAQALAFEHIDYSSDGAEGSRAAAAGAAVNDDGRSFRGIGFRRVGISGTAYNGITLFYQTQEMCGMCWGAKVRPGRILQLSDLAHAFEGVVFVSKGEFAHDNVGLVVLGCRVVGSGGVYACEGGAVGGVS